MKLNEFEQKLGTVSDAKLRQMLGASRSTGPDVAVKLILSECNRRGMDDLDAPAGLSDPGAPETRAPGSETAGFPREHAGYAGADAPKPLHRDAAPQLPPAIMAETGDPVSLEEADPMGSEAPATAPDWLNEESKSGLPVMVKVLLVLVILGGILGLASAVRR